MFFKQIFFPNSHRNYGYFLGCEVTRLAVVIDPFRSEEVENLLNTEGYSLAAIVNTHGHWDHVGGNQLLTERHGCKVYAHKSAHAPCQTDELMDGDILRWGEAIQLKVVFTPGHTMDSICLVAMDTYLLSGDTLFANGCGNCKNGGDVDVLFETFSKALPSLASSLILCPGHDYAETNTLFTIDYTTIHGIHHTMCEGNTLKQERMNNLFLLFSDPSGPQFSKANFVTLRSKRNQW